MESTPPVLWVSSNTAKVYSCLTCGYNTTEFRPIFCHLRRHTQTVSCDICGKAYSTIWEGRRHLALAHPSRQPLDFEQISRTVDPEELLVEVTKFHDDGRVEKRQLRGIYQCPLCGFQAWWESTMHKHLLASVDHQDGAPCDLCGEPVVQHRPASTHELPEQALLDCFRLDDEDIEDLECGARIGIEP